MTDTATRIFVVTPSMLLLMLAAITTSIAKPAVRTMPQPNKRT